jgi:hypothetical protein
MGPTIVVDSKAADCNHETADPQGCAKYLTIVEVVGFCKQRV